MSFPINHTIRVDGRRLSVDDPRLVQNNVNTETVTLELGTEWDGLNVVLNLGRSSGKPVALPWTGEPLVVPSQVVRMPGLVNASVVGYGDDDRQVVTVAAPSLFHVVESGFADMGADPVPESQSMLNRLLEAAEKAEKFDIKGVEVTTLPSGSQASGSIDDGLISLSIPAGEQGIPGEPGDEGKAATIRVGTVSKGDAAKVVNSGTENEAVFDFTLPNGDKGDAGTAATIEIGTVTTGEPGTDAIVENVGTPTNARLNITIPRGEKGEDGNVTGGLASVAVSDPLTGDGTAESPISIGVIPIEKGGTGATDVKDAGIKLFKGNVDASGGNISDISKVLIYQSDARDPQSIFAYKFGSSVWGYIQSKIETAYPDITQLVNLVAKVQALETAKNPVKLDEGADINSIINTSGTYIKLYGKTAVNGPTKDYNKAGSKYVITVINDYGDAYQKIEPIAGVSDIYYRTKDSVGIGQWHKVSSTTQQ